MVHVDMVLVLAGLVPLAVGNSVMVAADSSDVGAADSLGLGVAGMNAAEAAHILVLGAADKVAVLHIVDLGAVGKGVLMELVLHRAVILEEVAVHQDNHQL